MFPEEDDEIVLKNPDMGWVAYENYGLDCYSEGAAEYLIPYVNGGEGPLDIMNNGGPITDGMNVQPQFRIPFWKLVYHDCYSLSYHWEFGLNESTSNDLQDMYVMVWRKRNIFSGLVGCQFAI
jgi:hypothetical protein